MNNIFFNRGNITVKELLVVSIISLFFILIIVYDDSSIRPNVELKTCIANMETLHHAARLLIMEDPNIVHITPQLLLEKKYIKKIPKCPSYRDGHYIIKDAMGTPVDVVCVHGNNNSMGHGSYLSLKKMYNIEK